MTLEEFVTKAEAHYERNRKYQRRGQAYMNYLYYANRIWYETVTGTDCDPYYNDDKIPAFLEFLSKLN